MTADGIYFEDDFLELTGPIYYGKGMVEADGTSSPRKASASNLRGRVAQPADADRDPHGDRLRRRPIDAHHYGDPPARD